MSRVAFKSYRPSNLSRQGCEKLQVRAKEFRPASPTIVREPPISSSVMQDKEVVVLIASRFRMRTELDLLSLPSFSDHQISFSKELPLFVKDLEYNGTFALPHHAGQDFHAGNRCKLGSRLNSVTSSSSACLSSARSCEEEKKKKKKNAPETRPMSSRLIPRMHGVPKIS